MLKLSCNEVQLSIDVWLYNLSTKAIGQMGSPWAMCLRTPRTTKTARGFPSSGLAWLSESTGCTGMAGGHEFPGYRAWEEPKVTARHRAHLVSRPAHQRCAAEPARGPGSGTTGRT
jgi:hypothetical protein